ncbi:MAG: ABC transporter [Methylophaga sp.]|jgi:putative ABC transport system ATP-binding protein|uniref:ABC transporter ATP-binding protein n=2 Tax=Methylophaga TaxID=40222 RepID=UPI000C8AC7FC|nr:MULTISPECIES: ATP-binding cassette domain-containing protein [unclassified Methylophaga]MAK65643.1 ABC transporter [Methylophaga sp.]MAY16366.1 ABC transporter [Methylophaga sp.]HAO24167.1 ABC transporter [Methylophaga sp.]HCD06550.1 ABC transporter [Methylophaga sp.]|tara:strand:- start:47050 stop:47781 length:732 start_codon:yes stop_codon:yes gene_type:complete
MSTDRQPDLSNDFMIQVQNLSHSVDLGTDKLSILQHVNLDIRKGESAAIVGRSGSGKTTLLGLLAGLDLPSSGTVKLDGHIISALSEDERASLRSQRVGFVFQSFQLLPTLSAIENVMLPIELAGLSNAKTQAENLLERVGLGERMQHTPRQLSGGEQQRVAIARAFAVEPKVLFADEPTGNLDTRTGEAITDLLMALNREQGTTLVMVTHDQQLADRCQRHFVIDAGVLHEHHAADAGVISA